jgi:hypothetical protein
MTDAHGANRFSLVVCSTDDRKFARAHGMYTRLLGEALLEVVRISDAPSLAEGYNRGARQSRGDPVIFSHDDVTFLAADFAQKLMGHLAAFDVVGVAGTTRLVAPQWWAAGPPYIYGQVAHPSSRHGGFDVPIYGNARRAVAGIQALDGVFLAVRRSALERVSFDQDVFDGFHLYDIDFTFSAYLSGLRLGVANDLYPIHASGGRYDDAWKRYALKFLAKHGPRLPRVNPRPMRWALLRVQTREEVIEVMTPSHWEPISQVAGAEAVPASPSQ